MHGCEREARARGFGRQMRPRLGRADSLRAAAVHVGRGVVGAPAHLRAEGSAPGPPRAHVRLAAAVHGERDAGEVGEDWRLTVAHHPEQRRGVLHRSLGLPVQCVRAHAAHITCAHGRRETHQSPPSL